MVNAALNTSLTKDTWTPWTCFCERLVPKFWKTNHGVWKYGKTHHGMWKTCFGVMWKTCFGVTESFLMFAWVKFGFCFVDFILLCGDWCLEPSDTNPELLGGRSELQVWRRLALWQRHLWQRHLWQRHLWQRHKALGVGGWSKRGIGLEPNFEQSH